MALTIIVDWTETHRSNPTTVKGIYHVFNFLEQLMTSKALIDIMD